MVLLLRRFYQNRFIARLLVVALIRFIEFIFYYSTNTATVALPLPLPLLALNKSRETNLPISSPRRTFAGYIVFFALGAKKGKRQRG